MKELCSSNLPHLGGGGRTICVSVDRNMKRRVFSASFSTARGYCSIHGESFPSFRKGIFENQLFFWSGSLGEGHDTSRISDTVFSRLGVS